MCLMFVVNVVHSMIDVEFMKFIYSFQWCSLEAENYLFRLRTCMYTCKQCFSGKRSVAMVNMGILIMREIK